MPPRPPSDGRLTVRHPRPAPVEGSFALEGAGLGQGIPVERPADVHRLEQVLVPGWPPAGALAVVAGVDGDSGGRPTAKHRGDGNSLRRRPWLGPHERGVGKQPRRVQALARGPRPTHGSWTAHVRDVREGTVVTESRMGKVSVLQLNL